jgi:hypothetical protein
MQALKHMRNETSKQIKTMQEDVNFANVNWEIVRDYLSEKLLEEFDDINIQKRLSMTSKKILFNPSLLSISVASDSCHHRRIVFFNLIPIHRLMIYLSSNHFFNQELILI